MAKPRGTDGSLLSSLPWTLVALALSVAPHVPYLPIWVTAAFFGCSGWRYLIEKRRRALPPAWLRAGLALTCFLGVFATYSTISGVGPGSALLAVMASLKLIETRERRDQFVLLFISIFLVMSSLLREQYLWSLPYLLISVLVIMTAWLRMSASTGETARQSFSTSGRLLLYAAPLTVAMWIFFPRIAVPFWAVPMDTGTATSGISDSMSPGEISSLSMSNAVAFRVRFDDEVPAARDLYWRGLVLAVFNGRTWTQNDPYEGPRAFEEVEVRGEPIGYEITLEPTRQQWVFALDMPHSWELERTFMGPQHQLARATPVDQRIAYKAVSYIDFSTNVDLSKYARSWYQRLPEGSNPRTQSLAEQMREAAGSDTAFIEAVIGKFNQEEYFYTLQPPALGKNSTDEFLFDTRQGFCEHYASAFAIMMRAAGIPARIVLGYHGGELNPISGHMTVRQSDAHAWNEVWIDGDGWYRIDPTGAVAPDRIDYGGNDAALDGVGSGWGFTARLVHDLTIAKDALDAKWNEWILGYGPENQNRFMEWMGMQDPSWRKLMLTLIAVVAVIVTLISIVLTLRYRSPAKDPAAILYQQFARKTGLEPETGETAERFAERLRCENALPAAAIHSVTHAYHEARYGPEENNEDSLQRLKAAVAAIGPTRSPYLSAR
ncbi:MAG: transglutaminase TgpA family protein [Woeseiaceae bacterium]